VQRALDDPRRGRAGGISQRENEPMVKKTTTTANNARRRRRFINIGE